MSGLIAIEREIQEDTKSNDLDGQGKQKIIHGLMYEPWSEIVSDFNGLISHSRGEQYDAIEGSLEDDYGRSRIEGFLDSEKSFKFDKTYAGRPPIQYSLEFDKEKGLYLGAWKGKDAFEGYSVCLIGRYLNQEDLDIGEEFFKSFDRMTDEQKSQAIIGYMVGEGQLNVLRDSETGEEMFSLSEEGKRLARDTYTTPEEDEIIDETVRLMGEEDKQGSCDELIPEDDIPF